MPSRSKAVLFLPIVVTLVAADRVTKMIAEAKLPRYIPHDVWGDVLRWTLVYNPGAAFGLGFGPYSRWIFMALTIGALVILWRMYRDAAPDATWKVLAISLVTAGAIGNFIDRIISPPGVVDFIDVGIGATRWPTFNVADMAVSTGAVLLAIVLWGEDREAAQRAVSDGRQAA